MLRKGLKHWLAASRHRIERDLMASPNRRYFSASVYAQYRVAVPLIQRYARGKLIDLGCGDTPFRDCSASVTDYHTLDLWPRSQPVTYVADMQDMAIVPDGSYDSAICFEVLEHVPDPHKAMREAHRILKPGGCLLLSVPHLSRLHDEPHDYQRFTAHGVRELYHRAGFEVVEICAKAGLLSFIGHQLSTLILSATWPVWGLRHMAWFINKWLLVHPCYVLDRAIGPSGVMPLGYVGVGVKPRGNEEGPTGG